MIHNNRIRRFCAALLLLLAVFASLPKTFLHEVIADHQDLPSCTETHTASVLHQKEKDCDCDDLVVNAAFLLAIQNIPATAVDFSGDRTPLLPAAPLTTTVSFNEVRGPPSIGFLTT